jgi:hypothetical protein
MILLVGNVKLWLEVLGMAEPIQFGNCLQRYGKEVARILGGQLIPDSVIGSAFSADAALPRLE